MWSYIVLCMSDVENHLITCKFIILLSWFLGYRHGIICIVTMETDIWWCLDCCTVSWLQLPPRLLFALVFPLCFHGNCVFIIIFMLPSQLNVARQHPPVWSCSSAVAWRQISVFVCHCRNVNIMYIRDIAWPDPWFRLASGA